MSVDTSNLKYFLKPKGILRVVSMVFSIIAFGTMATESNLNGTNDGYSHWSEFSFLVAANAIAFSLAFIFCVCYIFRQQVDALCFFFPMAEWGLDAIVCLLVFLSAVMAAVRCESLFDNGVQKFTCQDINSTADKNNVIAAIVFGFFNFLVLLIINVLDFFEHRAGEQSEKAAASNQPK